MRPNAAGTAAAERVVEPPLSVVKPVADRVVKLAAERIVEIAAERIVEIAARGFRRPLAAPGK